MSEEVEEEVKEEGRRTRDLEAQVYLSNSMIRKTTPSPWTLILAWTHSLFWKMLVRQRADGVSRVSG